MQYLTNLVDVKLLNAKLESNLPVLNQISSDSVMTAQKYSSRISSFQDVDATNSEMFLANISLDITTIRVNEDDQANDEMFNDDERKMFNITVEYRILFELNDGVEMTEEERSQSNGRFQTDVMTQVQPYVRSSVQRITLDSLFDGESLPVSLF